MKKHFYWERLCYVPFYNGNRDSFSKSRNKVYHAKGGGLADCQSTPRS